MGRKIREPAHEKGTAIRYAISVMLNLGESANLRLSDVAPALVTDRNAGSMTLNERVHTLFDQLHVPVFRYLLTEDPRFRTGGGPHSGDLSAARAPSP